MDTLLQDVRYAVRGIRARPGLVVTAVLSLAVAIGPTSAIFSVIDGLGLRPLPVRDPGGLLVVTSDSRGGASEGCSYPEFRDIRAQVPGLADVAVSGPQGFGVSADGFPPEVVLGATASANYFSLLGVRPALGRTFSEEEDRTPGTGAVAILGDRFWKRRYQADPSVVGKTLRLNTTTFTIVGVLPPGFAGTQPVLAPEVWIPSAMMPAFGGGGRAALEARDRHELTVLARLRPGVSFALAEAQLTALSTALAREYPDTSKGRRLTLAYEESARRRLVTLAAMLVLGLVGVLLLVACGNVAGLLLGRADARRAEIAVRVSLGASRRRLVRQLLTESACISLLAAAAGLALSFMLIRILPALVPALPLDLNFDFRIDWRVLAFTVTTALIAAPVFGLAPALFASRPDLGPLIKGAPTAAGRGSRRFATRHLLVVAQIAVALALLVAAGLFARTLINAEYIDPGFAQRPMLFCTMSPQAVGYTQAQARAFYRQLMDRLESAPYTEGVALASHVPLNALYGGGFAQPVSVPGREAPPGREPLRSRYNVVEAGYFETMGTRILRGRDVGPADRADAPRVVLLNQTLARRLFDRENPIGRSVLIGGSAAGARPRACEVVGIVQDAKYLSLLEAQQPYFYVPYGQESRGEMTVILRVRGSTAEAAAGLRREIRALDAAMPALQIMTLDEHMRLALVVERLTAGLTAVLGGLGLLLSVVGLYGVIACLVSRRTREIGIRVAIGATPGQVVRQVLRDGARLTVAGAGAGLVLAVVAMRAAASSLYGVAPWDPLVLAGATLVLAAVALAATWLPARRAARIDPIAALRIE
jgi:predicted permease